MDKTYNFYEIFKESEFSALGVISKTYTLELEGIGLKDVLVTKGNLLGITYEGVYVPLGVGTATNFYQRDGFAILREGDAISLGVEV